MPAPEENAHGGGSPGANHQGRHGWLARLFGTNSRESAATQSYRRLALQLDFDLGKGERGHCLMLTAPDSARVTCEASIELAHLLAEELGHRVLLIDATFGSGGVGAALGHAREPGLSDLLRDADMELDRAIIATGHPRVALLAAGHTASGSVPLKPEELRGRLERARSEFDYVLVQSSPLLREAKSLVFPSLVDYVLLLTVEGQTLLDDLEAGQQALVDCKASKVGIVLAKPPRRWFTRR